MTIIKTNKSFLITLLLSICTFVYASEQDTIHDAIKRGNIAKVQFFIDENPSIVNEPDDEGRTPLHIAVYHINPEIMILLCKQKGININQQDNQGYTPLHEAAGCGRDEVISLLCQQPGIDKNKKDNEGRTPLQEAVHWGHQTAVQILCQQEGVHVNQADDEFRMTPLHRAADMREVRMAYYLCSHQMININQKNSFGFTPLHYAARGCCKEIVNLICNRPEVKIDRCDKCGKTPLHCVPNNKWGIRTACQLFLYGANPQIADSKGNKPLDNPACQQAWQDLLPLRIARNNATMALLMGLAPRTGAECTFRKFLQQHFIRKIKYYLPLGSFLPILEANHQELLKKLRKLLQCDGTVATTRTQFVMPLVCDFLV